MGNYVTADQLRQSAEADEASSNDYWERLAEAVSRLFDRECEVSDNTFQVAEAAASIKSFRTNGTEYLQIPPYIGASIAAITVDGTALTLNDEDEYFESGNYLILGNIPAKRTVVSISAKWGFDSVPAEIVQACIEQGLFMWRRKDLAFSDLSGVSTAAVVAEFSPTFVAITRRYREIYSSNNYFA